MTEGSGFRVQGISRRLGDTEVWVLLGKPENSSSSLFLDLTGMNLNQELRKAGKEKFSPEFLSSRYNLI